MNKQQAFPAPLWVVQTNDGYYVNTCSFHITSYGADWQCAHDMNEEIDADSQFEADKYQIVKREWEL